VSLLVLPPPIGLADNGDFPRVMGRFGIGYPTDRYEDRYFRHFIVRYPIHARFRWLLGLPSSEWLFVALAYLANPFVTAPGWFDIRVLGLLHAATFVGAACLLAKAAGSLGWPAWSALSLSLIFVFSDVGYLEYFNSFYSEPASFLALFLTVAACVRLAAPGGQTRACLAGYLAAAAVFVCAKPQNVPLGFLMAAFTTRLAGLRPDPAWGRASRRAALAVAALAALYGLGTARIMNRYYPYVSVFNELLPYSPDPRRDLAELGVDPALVRYSGVGPFTPATPVDDPAFRAAFTERVSLGALLLFHARHPVRAWAAFERCAPLALTLRPSGLGNYEQQAGHPPFARSRTFSAWSRLRTRLAPKTAAGLLGLLALCAAGAMLWRARTPGPGARLLAEGILLLAAMAAAEYALVALTAGLTDTAKHMFLFSLLFDMTLVATAVVVAFRLGPRAATRPAGPTG
jgi:hypothetical protein